MKNLTVENFFRVLKCPVCREPLELGNEGDGVMCRSCRAKWELEKDRLCIECGLPAGDCRCRPELMSKSKVTDLIKLCFYDSESGSSADRLILYMKDYRDMRVFDFAAGELADPLRRYFDQKGLAAHDLIFTYAPRSRSSRNRRGFDQAEILTERIANFFGAEFMTTISRNLFSRKQKGLDSAKRLQNSENSFRLRRGVRLTGKTVVLIDDVVTTGASLSVCTKLLISAGAKRVICASFAFADLNN